MRNPDFFGYYFQARFDLINILGIAYANALLFVSPVVFESGEKVMTGNYENAAFFQPPIQFSISNLQSGQP